MNNCKNNVQRKVFKLRSSISVVLSLISIAIVFLIACRHVQQQNTSIDETNKLNFIQMLKLKNQFIKSDDFDRNRDNERVIRSWPLCSSDDEIYSFWSNGSEDYSANHQKKCRLRRFTTKDVTSCIDEIQAKSDRKWLHFAFIGDSRMRQQFYSLLKVWLEAYVRNPVFQRKLESFFK